MNYELDHDRSPLPFGMQWYPFYEPAVTVVAQDAFVAVGNYFAQANTLAD
jgi:hypothetical protein